MSLGLLKESGLFHIDVREKPLRITIIGIIDSIVKEEIQNEEEYEATGKITLLRLIS